MSERERRRRGRLRQSVPLRVRGWDPDGSAWDEVTQTEDMSAGGTGFFIRHAVVLGQVLQLSLPLPARFRQFSLADATYVVYAVVRHVGGPKVGVMFIGKYPPRRFNEQPTRRLLENQHDQQVRQFQRYAAMVNVRLRRIEAPPGEPIEEITVTENVSQGGVMLLTALPIARDELVEVEEMNGGDFATRAAVRAVSLGADNLPRLGLMFLDPEAVTHSVGWLRRIGVPVEPIRPSAAVEPLPQVSTPPQSLRFQHLLFDECREGAHSTCLAGRAARLEARFLLCSCACHATGEAPR